MQNKYGYVFTDEYYEKEEEINMKAAELEALITEHNRRQKEDGIDFRKEDAWFPKVTDRILEFYTLDDHLANAGVHDRIMDDIKEIIVKSYIDEGLLPYDIALLSEKQFKAMKKETLK